MKKRNLDLSPLKDLHIMGFGGTFNSASQRNADMIGCLEQPVGRDFMKRYINPVFAQNIYQKQVRPKHSDSITRDDVEYLSECIINSPHQNILVTTGLNYMAENVEQLHELLALEYF